MAGGAGFTRPTGSGRHRTILASYEGLGVRAFLFFAAVAGLAFQPVHLAGQEPVRLGRVLVTGNQRVEAEAIRVRLSMQPGSVFSEQAVDADVRALYKMGFFSDVEAFLDHTGGQWVLTYHVTERPFVKDVKIEGNKKIDTEELEGALRVRPNTIFDPEKARKGIEEAKKLYEKKGYLDAVIDYETTPVGEDEVEVTFKVDEKQPIRIEKIVFEGNRAFSDRQLKKILATKERWFLSFLTGAGNLDREVLQTDTERLTAFYYEHGYIDVRVDDPVIERVKDALKVTFKIDEGEVYDFGKIEMTGEVLPNLDMKHVHLHAESGETFRPSKLREDINLLTEAYGDRGYAFVNVTPQTAIDPSSRTVDVRYKVNRGPEVYIDRIEISGNVKTRDKVIRRELELQEQKRFSGSKLRRSQQRLKRLGFFEDVNITTRKADREDRLDVIVDVKEGSTGAFSAGAGVSSGESFLFNVRLSEINLFGRGQRIVFNADFGSIRRNISLSFTEPYFLDTNLSLGVDAYNWQLIFDEFTRGGTGGSIRTLYPFTALGWNQLWGASLVDTRFGLDYRIEQSDISDVDATAASVIRAEQGKSLTSSITPRIYRDTRNSPFDPTNGSLQDFSIELAGLGGDSKFVKFESRTRWYRPIWKSPRLGEFTFSSGWTFGYGLGYGGQRELPLFERYFPGGINSVRGYSVRSLGPRVPVFSQNKGPNDQCPLGDNLCGQLIRRDVIGGSHQLIFNNEIIFPIVQSLGLKGVVFFDAGQAFSAAQGIQFSDMRTAAGFGLRWLSPIGPLRIEIGFPLNPRVGDDTQAVLFSFGGPP
jgi:outer membrane protein insertion porin family